MSSSSDRDRAEARRRARLAARGELPPEVDEATEPVEPERQGGLLGRIFPSPPPLPGRPDPLAGFDESGPLRPIRVRAFLLRQNLVAWLIPGFVAFLGYSASLFFGPQSFVSLLGTFVLFGALIGAGWFGWQRPTLFGTAAAIFAFVLVTAFVLFTSLQVGVTPDAFGTPGELALGVALQGTFQAALGFLGGWYGGYLRRRQAQVGATARRRR
jgi:hypothetical protein